MPRDRFGNLIKEGDTVKGRGYNIPHDVIGPVLRVVENSESCNLQVGVCAYTAGPEPTHVQTAGGEHGYATPITEYGTAGEFEILKAVDGRTLQRNKGDTLHNLSFSAALGLLKGGARAARKGWNGQGMFVFLVPGSHFTVNRPPLLGIYPDGKEIDYRPHLDMKAANGEVVPWVASQSDLLSDDWHIVEEPAA